jgi:hypothetical protein
MLLKVVHRRDNAKSCLISICRTRWYESSDHAKRRVLQCALSKAGFLPNLYRIDDLKLEARKNQSGIHYWHLSKLSRARDAWIIFVKIVILSKPRGY